MEIGLRRGTVSVEPHSSEWDINAKKTINKLKQILQNNIIDAEHIGSTAIKSICAKPIIDIVIGVNDFNDILSCNDVLEKKGFLFREQDYPDQYLYVCGNDNFITHHIHVVIYNSILWNNYINLRDYLNCHEEDAQRYSNLKIKLAKEYCNDRQKYTLLKKDLIDELLTKAYNWREQSSLSKKN